MVLFLASSVPNSLKCPEYLFRLRATASLARHRHVNSSDLGRDFSLAPLDTASLPLFRRTVYAAVAAAGGNDEIAGMEMEEGACDVNFYANGAPTSLVPAG